MRKIRNWKVKQWATAVGALMFVVCIVWVMIGLALSRPDSNPVESTPPAKSVDEPAVADSATPDSEASSDDEGNEPGEYPMAKLDSTGFAPMLVTDDPRQAAAAAATVLWSGRFDEGYIEFAEDFRTEALTRIGMPDPSYGGPGDIKTTVPPGNWSNQIIPPDPIAGDPLKAMVNTQYLPARSDGWWFMLGDQPSVESLVARGAVVTSKAIAVYDDEQVLELDSGVPTEIEEAWTPVRDGVTAHKFWVRVETEIDMGGQVAKSRNTAAFVVYCDPPAEGGICGVGLLTRSYPGQWQHQ